MSLGRRVRDLREKLGMNQKELANASQITQATISRIESEEVHQLKSEALKRLAKALKTTVDYLIGKTDKMTPSDIVDSDPQAKAIFRGYEKLSKEGKKQLADFLRYLQGSERDKKKH